MPKTDSPLRYPGGKTSIYPFVKNIVEHNNMNGCTYVEPFAGGSGLALKLLYNNIVDRLILNDIDPSIYTFWYCVLYKTEDFCQMLLDTPVTIKEWENQKEIFHNRGNGNILDFGFSTFFLNRTNVSGVLKGGAIGGKDQTGKYKIDARFNKENLIEKIVEVNKYKNNISLYSLDAIDFIHSILPSHDNLFVNYDPPYVIKGANLYTNFYNTEDHRQLAESITESQCHWIVTYDNCPLIHDIYNHYRKCYHTIRYSAGANKKTDEIVVFSPNMLIPATATLI